jgi:anti-sigma28 factor (negative regulator of flagellin synthesis)
MAKKPKPEWRKNHDELVRLTAEQDQRNSRIKEIVAELKAAIAKGDLTIAQAKADMEEMGLTEDDVPGLFT